MKITHMNHPRNGQLWLAVAAIAAATLLLLVTGCKSTSASYDASTGNWRVSDRRVLLRTEAEITANVDANGAKSVVIKAKSDPQTEAFKAIAEGAAAGAAKFIAP